MPYYTVNLCVFYFYKIIGKLTASLQLHEFSQRNPQVACTNGTVGHPIDKKSLSTINKNAN